MAEEQTKDYSNYYIGGIILVAIIGVFLLKSRETEHLAPSVGAQVTDQAFQAANQKRKASKNTFE
ncbi:hypothetical protein [methanotrophic endosymbiont of Bathymodiolus puteoserpentis (Logatchev)]|jgi:hypothetical protein|uniref:hypothetical protein n=1 Tax=methanotrophic endosymbiont of Bathymodiolus puteoserpentis (Logatchev) TaxID=343235 RepID=UPI0013CA4EF0|nr:hypothetical protein [methanotrophic endosymbiont of Bathymodiolus puteoserpentis (Logatchev)]SHE22859.1 hypothetical protein BPUTEOMOX_3078 [methanotrophic endosymbiont of Bathymodiolus puteoserpentis (Logatchev)]